MTAQQTDGATIGGRVSHGNGPGSVERVPNLGLVGQNFPHLVPFIPTSSHSCAHSIGSGCVSVSGWRDSTSVRAGNFTFLSHSVPLRPTLSVEGSRQGLEERPRVVSGQVQAGPVRGMTVDWRHPTPSASCAYPRGPTAAGDERRCWRGRRPGGQPLPSGPRRRGNR